MIVTRLRNGFVNFRVRERLEKIFGFGTGEIRSYEDFVDYLYRPTDAASLGVVRALFGLCMIVDIVEERGFSDVDLKWGDPKDCHFPLIDGMRPLPLHWMIVVYFVMWCGAAGIMLGWRFKTSCALFIFPYWYLFLLDKSYWNNHTYLYGLVATLMWGTQADKYFALDADIEKRGDKVPYWNYFVLKFQFFILYFLAGAKKSSTEWLEGYAMMDLSKHWVFDPFKIFLTTEQTDFFIVHWFAFIFDLTVAFWMLYEKTRIPAMAFCAIFHLMNSRLFSIGMFPYVCLATMPLFCDVNWPRKLINFFHSCKMTLTNKFLLENEKNLVVEKSKEDRTKRPDVQELSEDVTTVEEDTQESKNATSNNDAKLKQDLLNFESDRENDRSKSLEELTLPNLKDNGTIRKSKSNASRVTRKQKIVVSLLLIHISIQFFLPYSHFITKGYNNWVPGLYGYSWDMMMYAWDTVHAVVKIRDNESGEDNFIGPGTWVQNDRWMKHGDMARQYAFCLRDNLMREKEEILSAVHLIKNKPKLEFYRRLSSNISIFIDIWTSLNGRFQQRLFNPYVDLLTVDWHPFKTIPYLMPLLTQYNSYRSKLEDIQKHVFSWSNYTDVLFVADFPGMHLDNFVTNDLANTTLTVLEGDVTYNEEDSSKTTALTKGQSINPSVDKFHRVTTMSPFPACYMYTYTNQTRQRLGIEGMIDEPRKSKRLNAMKELSYKARAWIRTLSHIANAFLHLVYDVPMIRRVRLNEN